jgi:hypothetical protein
MSSKTTYIYASGDLLEQRNTYKYTPYHGQVFFAGWSEARSLIMRELPESTDSPSPEAVRSLAAILAEDIYDTAELLESVMDSLQSGVTDGPVEHSLACLAGRFEVSKRVHNSYFSHWRAVPSADYHDLALYLRFAEIMELAYSITENLVYLNALLKVVDTISAMVSELPFADLGRFKRLLYQEQMYVKNLLQAFEPR